MEFSKVYFIGIGGIGMSALARYFLHEGKQVGGYDRTETRLTSNLSKEGAEIHYSDDIALIDAKYKDATDTLIVYTPAIPADHTELGYFRTRGFEVVKRSEILGHLSENKYVMAVAGTHGKTTTTTMVAWFNHIAGGGSAFLGGISKNFDSNIVLGSGDRFAVEADEFDRSFLKLYPDVAVITSADADHLDIYGTHEAMKEAFSQFIRQIKKGGALIIKKGVELNIDNPDIAVYRYSYDEQADFYAANISVREDGCYRFDMVCPDRTVKDCTLGIPGRVNVENAIAAAAMLWVAGTKRTELSANQIESTESAANTKGMATACNVPDSDKQTHCPEQQTIKPTRQITNEEREQGLQSTLHNSQSKHTKLTESKQPDPQAVQRNLEGFDEEKLREAMSTFNGVKRRFDFYINTPELIYMDDYAHHPEELHAALSSVRAMFPGRRITAIFQPHLYSRTKDFYREFAQSLSLADEVILVPIYPAREEPIAGVTSQLIGDYLTVPYSIIDKECIAKEVGARAVDIVISFGAGDIENHCRDIAATLTLKRTNK